MPKEYSTKLLYCPECGKKSLQLTTHTDKDAITKGIECTKCDFIGLITQLLNVKTTPIKKEINQTPIDNS